MKKLQICRLSIKIARMLKYYNNISLKNHNTFGIDVQAKHLYECANKDDLLEFLNQKHEKPLFILGEGSNVLFTKDYEGTILKPLLKGIEIIEENEDEILIEVGAGENWDEFVSYCVEKNWGGIENLSLIPGTVGSSPVQNVGAYGVEVKDVIQKVFAIDIEKKESLEFSNEACQFSYRNSIFKNELKGKLIIYKVAFKLSKKPKHIIDYGSVKQELEKHDGINLHSIRNAIIDIRRSKLPEPTELGNAGSFFKNPIVDVSKLHRLQKKDPSIPYFTIDDKYVKLAAGWLIDRSGLKGYKHKNAGVHKNQALVLVNYGDATGNDILELSSFVQDKVCKTFGIKLDPEVNIL